jgi:hypothetical protein
MDQQTWPPPPGAERPAQQDRRSHQKIIDLIGKTMVAVLLLYCFIWFRVQAARTNIDYVTRENRHGILEARKWDKTDPGWRKHFVQGPPRKSSSSDRFFARWSGHLGF